MPNFPVLTFYRLTSLAKNILNTFIINFKGTKFTVLKHKICTIMCKEKKQRNETEFTGQELIVS